MRPSSRKADPAAEEHHGVAEPYLVTNPTESAFVPNALLQPYVDMLKQQQSSGR